MHFPNPTRAQSYLAEATARNPGPWVAHSRSVAEAARRIAEALGDLDPAAAEVLGLLHDIGRREGVTGMRHTYDGYRYLLAEGHPDAARICLTHSLPVKDLRAGSSSWDCTEGELDEVRTYLDGIEYDDYDRLLQLCDAIAVPDGFCLLEKRLVDVLMRYQNFNEFTLPKWQGYFAIKRDFETRLGSSIYALLPGIAETTFETALPVSD